MPIPRRASRFYPRTAGTVRKEIRIRFLGIQEIILAEGHPIHPVSNSKEFREGILVHYVKLAKIGTALGGQHFK